MLSTVQIVSPPADEPVSLDLVRRHCRIDQYSDDDLLAGYLTAARTMAELYLSRVLITQTLLWTVTPVNRLRPWRNRYQGVMELPRAPVQSVASVTVLDARGNSTSIGAAALPVPAGGWLLGYRVDLAQVPARLIIGLDTVLSDGRLLRDVDLENIQVAFVAGYGSDGTLVPRPVIQAILLGTADLYENRGDVGAALPQAAEWLLDPYRLMFLG